MARLGAFGLGAALAAVTAVAGCSEYLDRRDTLSLGSGEAVETNINAHRVDPWPKVAQNRDLTFSGERMLRAARREACEDSPHSTVAQMQEQFRTGLPVLARDAPVSGGAVAAGSLAGAQAPAQAPTPTVVNTGPGNITVTPPATPPASRC
jgi:hypothetical protein